MDEWTPVLLDGEIIDEHTFCDLTICQTCYTIPCMDTHYTQLRIWRTTLKKLRLLHALTGKKQIELIDQWADEALKKHGYQDIQIQALSDEKE